MTFRHAWSATMAGLLTCGIAAFAPASGGAQEASRWSQAPFPSDDTVLNREEGGPITVVGCLQSERDYRSENGIHRAKKPGRGDEFVLTNVVVGSGLTVPQQTCTPSGAGRSIELTGVTEDHVRPRAFLPGNWIEVSGLIKRGSLREVVGTTGNVEYQPTGGSRMGHDLRLRELNVESFRLAPVAAPTVIAVVPVAPPEAPPAPEPVPQAQAPAPPAPEQPAPTTGEVQQLPKTASPLSLIGLIGLLSLGGALVLRASDRRRVFGHD